MILNSTDRDLFRRIWALSWPMVVYNLLEMTVGMADLVMVRPLGPAATAAIGVSRQVTFLVEATALAVSTGVITLVSQGVGAGAHDRVRAVVRQSVWLVLLLAVPTTVAGVWLTRPLLIGMSASDDTLAHADPYLRVYFMGVVFLWGNIVGTAVFRGWGDVWTPLKLALGVNLLNVALNYLCIFGIGPIPALEVQGAAIGTVAARACGAIVYVVVLQRRIGMRMRPGGVEKPVHPENLISRILRIGSPIALAGLLRNGSRLIFLAIVGASERGMSFHAAVGVGLQLRLISILPALAFQTASATLVGQAIGRGDYRDAELLGRRSVVLLGLIMVVVVGLIIVGAGPLASLFIAEPESAVLGARVLRWFAAAQFFSALSIATQGALTGAGDTAPAMRYTLVSQWLVMLPLAYVLQTVLGWTPDGALAAWALAPLISLVLTWRRLQSGRWKAVRNLV